MHKTWCKESVAYQITPRNFYDCNGAGDLLVLLTLGAQVAALALPDAANPGGAELLTGSCAVDLGANLPGSSLRSHEARVLR